ncbi:Pre-mRNA-splicing factor 38A [Lonchura striata]|uniref:Pre-mRNA-splicing factor 38B n=1 Tax=Lonchura striata TaxID=40157 RepID=A0A218UX78_9PASE|nr:Pre-mRNA-splicing factor 38A [Lonchura striata domestica]
MLGLAIHQCSGLTKSPRKGLVEKIIRTRIYESKYWKEECFGLTAELVVDKAMELKCVGGVYGGNIKPTPFLCLTLKMLQIQPEKDIIVEFIKNEDFRYVRMLGALYMRLTGTAIDCYKYLEPLYNDYRKIKSQNRNGGFELMHMDEFIDELLHEERVCDIILPRLQKRYVLEEAEQLEPRVSALEEDMDGVESSEGEEEEELERIPSPDHRRRGYRDLYKLHRSLAVQYRWSRSRVALELSQRKTRQTCGPVEPPVNVTDGALSWPYLLNLVQVRSCRTASSREAELLSGRALGTADEKLAIDSGPAMLRFQKFAGKSALLVEKSFESSAVVQDLKA